MPPVPPEVPPALPEVVELPPVDPDAPLLASAIAVTDRDNAAAATVVKKVIRMLNSVDAVGPNDPMPAQVNGRFRTIVPRAKPAEPGIKPGPPSE
jgi:hypothetical protein